MKNLNQSNLMVVLIYFLKTFFFLIVQSMYCEHIKNIQKPQYNFEK